MKKLFKVTSLIFPLLFLVIFACMEVSCIGWTTTEVVSTESASDSREPSLDVDLNGTVHIAWYDCSFYGGAKSYWSVFYKRFEPGTGWTTTDVVAIESTSDAREPSLDVGSDGTVHIAWMDHTDYDGADNDRDIFYKKFEPGTGWTVTEVVSTESTNNSWNPSLGVDLNGTVHIAWQDWTDYGGSGNDTDIFYKRFEPGTGWTTTEIVSTESISSSWGPSLDVGSDGTAHITWQDYDGASIHRDIVYRSFVPGSGWTLTEVVSTERKISPYESSLRVGPNGTVHIAWRDSTGEFSSSDREIEYKRFEPGTGWTTTEVVSTNLTSKALDTPSLGIGSDGTVHISWLDYEERGNIDSDLEIFYKRFEPGTGWTTTEIVSTESIGSSWSHSLDVGLDGIVHIAWDESSDSNGSGDDMDIFYKTLDINAPVTVDDYEGQWHSADFTITLLTTDNSGKETETYYKINDGATTSVGSDGQPSITAEGADNKLEYWSMDKADNEEFPHNILTEIKLDKTPPVIGAPTRQPSGEVPQNQSVTISVSLTDSISGMKNATLYYSIDDGDSWVDLPMSYHAVSGDYQTVIPKQAEGTIVNYRIVAYDNAGNSVAKDNAGEYYIYTVVISEFSIWIMLLSVIIVTLAVIIYKKRLT